MIPAMAPSKFAMRVQRIAAKRDQLYWATVVAEGLFSYLIVAGLALALGYHS